MNTTRLAAIGVAVGLIPGAGHAFLRRGEPQAEIERAWEAVFSFLEEAIGK